MRLAMKVAVWMALWLLSGLLSEPGRLDASDNLVDLVLLFDSTQLRDWNDRWRAAELGRDVVNNLPPRVSVQAFRFGDERDVVSLTMDSLTAESLAGVGLGNNKTTLPQALLEMERRLCGRAQTKSSSGKALVVVGRGTGNERLELTGACQITVYSVGASSENDPILRELAERTHGAYYSLARTKGYTVSKAIRVKIWMPSLLQSLRQEGGENGSNSLFAFYISFILLAMILVVALMAYLRAARHARPVAPRKMTVEQPVLPDKPPVLEAGLKICSEAGRGQGIFWFESREAVILGGRRDVASEQVDLTLDDPLAAGEHCRIYLDDGRFFAVDMETKEGTLVNGEKLREPKLLSPGDELQIGSIRFEFVVSQV
jgi:FHA domain